MCEPDRGVPLGGVLAVAGIMVGGVVVLRVVVASVPVLVALSQAVLGACAVGTWLLCRLFRYGSPAEVFRRHRRVRLPAEPPAQVVAAAKALYAGRERKAIEAAPRPGVTVTLSARDYAERMSR